MKNEKKEKSKTDKIRRPIQFILGIAIYLLLQAGIISLGFVVIIGSVLGIIFGKVFCRWLCPIGIIMEILLKTAPDEKARGMYQYHKLGCPIAWISGLLNKVSLFTIRKSSMNKCIKCNKCDDVCYISNLNSSFSLYKDGHKNPANSYTCSRCYACVEICPTNYLEFKVRKF
ncbi:4Fe-4S binding protein [bacterium]|nr:4Fe-4S binding protein [bacterium]